MIARRNSEEDDISKYISEVQFVLPDNTWINADVDLPVGLWADSIRVRMQDTRPSPHRSMVSVCTSVESDLPTVNLDEVTTPPTPPSCYRADIRTTCRTR